MNVKCPVCHSTLSEKSTCRNGHSYKMVDGILRLMHPEFELKLSDWLKDFEEFRGLEITALDYEGLPESGIEVDPAKWRARQLDLNIIRSLGIESGTALDIGTWNGWLANRLSQDGLDVTAVDYFVHHLDGMGAKKYYGDIDWQCIQMDLEDLSLLASKFDIVIVNRCYPYFSNAIQMVKTIMDLLQPEGKIIITGLNVIAENKGTKPLRDANDIFQSRYGRSIQFKPFKGFVDASDLRALKGLGFEISLYPNLRNRVKGFLRREASFFALYSNLSIPED